MRVLIAEDNALERQTLQWAIQRLGHECVVAADGVEAWQLYQAQEADVVISDWLMPGMDGRELCAAIRERGAATRYTYFLFLTGLADKAKVIQAMRGGADDYLVKPLNLDDLAARLLAAARVKWLEERHKQPHQPAGQTPRG